MFYNIDLSIELRGHQPSAADHYLWMVTKRRNGDLAILRSSTNGGEEEEKELVAPLRNKWWS